MMKKTIKEIQQLCENILINRGLSTGEASIIVEDYLDAELRGKLSHGLAAFSVVANDASARGKFVKEFEKGVVTLYNGNGDIGHLVARKAVEHSEDICNKFGVSIIGIKNIKRFATPGSIANIGAKKGLISLVFEYGGQAFMSPYGSAEAVISTNPIGIGIPYKHSPILLDMATSTKAFYYIDLAKKLGQSIPADWGIDREGNSTTDPQKINSVSPFGSYKGYALAFVLEIITGIFLGVDVGLKGIISNRGALLIFLKQDLFMVNKEDFEGKIESLISEIKNSKTAPGFKNIYIPGEQGEIKRVNALKEGFIDLDENIYNDLSKLL